MKRENEQPRVKLIKRRGIMITLSLQDSRGEKTKKRGFCLAFKTLINRGYFLTIFIALSSCSNESQTSIDPNGDGTTITPLIDSNTNWLLSCSADSDCGEGEHCSCGSCVIPCAPMGMEGARCMTTIDHPAPPVVECVEAEPVSEVSSCGEDYQSAQTGICLLACTTNDECPSHLLCHEGRCVRPRRGETRGCADERECVEAGGDPERCHILCEEEFEGGMSLERQPPPPEREILACEQNCIEDGYAPEDCRSRCAVCDERCPLLEEPREVQECEMRCMHRDDHNEDNEDEEVDGNVDEALPEND